jgi:hypothetical protein
MDEVFGYTQVSQRRSTAARSNLPLAASVYAFPSEQMNGMRSKHRDTYKSQPNNAKSARDPSKDSHPGNNGR